MLGDVGLPPTGLRHHLPHAPLSIRARRIARRVGSASIWNFSAISSSKSSGMSCDIVLTLCLIGYMVDNGRRVLYPMPSEVQVLERKKSMSETLILIAFVAGWIILNRWLLPRLGVPT